MTPVEYTFDSKQLPDICVQLEVSLTHKQLNMDGYLLSTVVNDTLVLKYQVISIQSADQISNALDRFEAGISHL